MIKLPLYSWKESTSHPWQRLYMAGSNNRIPEISNRNVLEIPFLQKWTMNKFSSYIIMPGSTHSVYFILRSTSVVVCHACLESQFHKQEEDTCICLFITLINCSILQLRRNLSIDNFMFYFPKDQWRPKSPKCISLVVINLTKNINK